MNQFVLQQGKSPELRLFPHIREVGIRKNGAIELNAFSATITDHIRFYYILEGKFDWCIQHRSYDLFPGDLALILPGQSFGSDNGVLEPGAFTWIEIGIPKNEHGD